MAMANRQEKVFYKGYFFWCPNEDRDRFRSSEKRGKIDHSIFYIIERTFADFAEVRFLLALICEAEMAFLTRC